MSTLYSKLTPTTAPPSMPQLQESWTYEEDKTATKGRKMRVGFFPYTLTPRQKEHIVIILFSTLLSPARSHTQTEQGKPRKTPRTTIFSMHCSNPSSCLLIAIAFLLLSFPHFVLSDPRISQAGLLCGNAKAPVNSNYIPSFIKEMESLSQTVTAQNWASHSVNFSTLPIYGFAQCFQDLSHTDCLLCYAASRTKLPRCLPSVSARIYLDGCFLRYDNYSFYSEDIDPLRDTVNCSSNYGVMEDEGKRWEFEERVGQVVENVVRLAVGKGLGFGMGEVGGVYALAQCWRTVGSNGCGNCLRKAGREVRGCLPRGEGRALNAGCYLRYSTEKFYNEGGEEGRKGKSVTAKLSKLFW